MKRSAAIWCILICLAGCISTPDRRISPADRVFGKVPGADTVLRLKQPCPVTADDGSTYMLPAGDYPPVAADAHGIYYEVPLMAVLRRADRSVWLSGVGVHFPIKARATAAPVLWVEGVGLERGNLLRDKREALPEACWKPYGQAMTVLHRGVQVTTQESGSE